jgi:hypothetical protein
VQCFQVVSTRENLLCTLIWASAVSARRLVRTKPSRRRSQRERSTPLVPHAPLTSTNTLACTGYLQNYTNLFFACCERFAWRFAWRSVRLESAHPRAMLSFSSYCTAIRAPRQTEHHQLCPSKRLADGRVVALAQLRNFAKCILHTSIHAAKFDIRQIQTGAASQLRHANEVRSVCLKGVIAMSQVCTSNRT